MTDRRHHDNDADKATSAHRLTLTIPLRQPLTYNRELVASSLRRTPLSRDEIDSRFILAAAGLSKAQGRINRFPVARSPTALHNDFSDTPRVSAKQSCRSDSPTRLTTMWTL